MTIKNVDKKADGFDAGRDPAVLDSYDGEDQVSVEAFDATGAAFKSNATIPIVMTRFFLVSGR